MIAPVPAIELVVQLAGAMQFKVTSRGGARRYATAPGTLFLTPAYQPAYEVEWANVAAEPVRTLHLYLAEELLTHAAAESGLDAKRVELRDDSGIQDPLLQQLSLAVARELDDPAAQNDLYADTAAQMLAVQLLRHHCTGRQPVADHRGKLSAPQLRRVQDYVQAQLGAAIRLEELAALVHLSTYHFCRLFKRTTGLSPNQYVIGQRLAKARLLLQAGELNVVQVAYAVGYQNPSHFAHLFHRQIGYAPATARQASKSCPVVLGR